MDQTAFYQAVEETVQDVVAISFWGEIWKFVCEHFDDAAVAVIDGAGRIAKSEFGKSVEAAALETKVWMTDTAMPTVAKTLDTASMVAVRYLKHGSKVFRNGSLEAANMIDMAMRTVEEKDDILLQQALLTILCLAVFIAAIWLLVVKVRRYKQRRASLVYG